MPPLRPRAEPSLRSAAVLVQTLHPCAKVLDAATRRSKRKTTFFIARQGEIPETEVPQSKTRFKKESSEKFQNKYFYFLSFTFYSLLIIRTNHPIYNWPREAHIQPQRPCVARQLAVFFILAGQCAVSREEDERQNNRCQNDMGNE